MRVNTAAFKEKLDHYWERALIRLRAAGESTLYVVLSPFRLLKVVCLVTGFLVLLGGSGASLYAYHFYRSLPDLPHMSFEQLKTVAQASVRARLEDKTHLRPWVPLKDISRDFLFTIVVSEDGKFYEHKGLNYDAIIDSLAENLRRREYAFGASTITQQVVKNLFLDNEKTLTRKLKEFLITRSLESSFSKNQIAELYLNIAEFGPDMYGAGAAAPVFFGKAPAQINAAEGAFIALMLPSPRRNFYSIFQNRNLTPVRRKAIRRVLREMAYDEFITLPQYQEYLHYDFFKLPPVETVSTAASVPESRRPAALTKPGKKKARSRRRH